MIILEYLDKNKEWLFSGGGVVLLGFLAAHLWQKFSPQESHQKGTVVIIQNPQVTHGMQPDQLSIQAPAHITKIVPITLPEISAAIENAPPLQRDDLAKNYIGLFVQWETKLFSAEKDGDDKVRLSLDFGPQDRHLVYCDVRLSEYKVLGVLPRGAPISVVGRIKNIERMSATLDEVQLFFHS